jgi:hypothetical protein
VLCCACPSVPPLTLGARDSSRAPGGTANEAKIASASASARCFGLGVGFVADRTAGSPVPDEAEPAGLLAAPGVGAWTTVQPASATTAAPQRARAPSPAEWPATGPRTLGAVGAVGASPAGLRPDGIRTLGNGIRTLGSDFTSLGRRAVLTGSTELDGGREWAEGAKTRDRSG